MAEQTGADALTGQGIVKEAEAVGKTVAGVAYKWGGKDVDGFDCSGFVTYVLKRVLPSKANLLGPDVAAYIASDLFEDVTGTPQPGDIIIFEKNATLVNHIGIVIDANTWMGAQSSTGVAKVKMTNSWWNKRTPKFRRLKGLSPAAVSKALAVP